MTNYEKLLFLYSTALEDGDWDTVSQIYAQAENDPALWRELERLAAEQHTELNLPTIQHQPLPALQKIRVETVGVRNGHIGATRSTPPHPIYQQSDSKRKVRMPILRIAVLLITILSGVFIYLDYNQPADNSVQVTPLSTSSSNNSGLQTEREVITTENIDRLQLIDKIDREAHIDGTFWFNNDTQYATYSSESITVYSTETFAEAAIFTPETAIQQAIGNPVNQQVAILHFTNGQTSITVYDLSNNANLYTITLGSTGATHLQFSPDGNYLATGNDDSPVYIWNAADGSQYLVVHGLKDELFAMAFSEDSQYLAVGGLIDDINQSNPTIGEYYDYGILVWDLKTGDLMYQLIGFQGGFGNPGDIDFSLDTSALVATQNHSNQVYMWTLKLDTKQPINTSVEMINRDFTLPPVVVNLDNDMINTTILSFADDEVLFIGGATGVQQQVSTYTLDDLEFVDRVELDIPSSTVLRSYALSLDKTKSLVIANETLTVLDIERLELLHTQTITQASINEPVFALNADGTRLAMPNFDQLEIIDMATGETLATTRIDPRQAINGLVFDPVQENVLYFSQALILASGTLSPATTPFRWDWSTDTVNNIQSAGLLGPVRTNEDNTLMYTILSHGLYALDIDGNTVVDLTRLDGSVNVTTATHIVLSADYLIYSRDNREIFTHHLPTSENSSFAAHSDNVFNLSVSQDETILVSLDKSGNIKLWDTTNNFAEMASLTNTQPLATRSAEIANDNRLVVLSGENGMQFWDYVTDEIVNELPDLTNSFILSEDGMLLITTLNNDILFYAVPAE